MISAFLLILSLTYLDQGSTNYYTKPPAKPHPNGTYILVAPRIFRPNSPYVTSIEILKPGNSYYKITLEIFNRQNVAVARKRQRVKFGRPTKIEIGPISLRKLRYKYGYYLKVRGEMNGRREFEARKNIRLEKKFISAFIQTDKAVYKPGSLVHFRVLLITPQLKPYQGTVSLKIVDPQKNIMKQFLNVSLDQGVASMEIQLADEVPLGDWAIKAQTTNGVKVLKHFTVEKYVLPKFEFTISGPSFVTIKNDIVIGANAKYTYGKGVRGPVTISAWKPHAKTASLTKTATLDKNGQASVRFTNEECLENDLLTTSDVKPQYYRGWFKKAVDFKSTVTEELTGIQRSSDVEVPFYETQLKLKVEKLADNFKPGIPLKLLVAVVRQDDTPMPSGLSRSVYIRYTQHFENPRNHRSDHYYTTTPPPTQAPTENGKWIKLNEDGTKLTNLYPSVKVDSVSIKASYPLKNGKTLKYKMQIRSTKSPSDSFIQLAARIKEVRPRQRIKFTLNSTEIIGKITYQVMNRGKILRTGKTTISKRSGRFHLRVRKEMSPKSRLVVYKMRDENKEILVDAMDFKVKGLYENDVKLSLDKSEAETGQKVKVTVKADPGSFVGLLAVDQSVLLLKKGNDITRELVEKEIETYDTSSASYCSWCGGPWLRGRTKRSIYWPWWTNGADAGSIFENAGLIVLTDALLEHRPMMIARKLNRVGPGAVGGGMSSSKTPLAPKTRSKFPETWLWLDSKTDATGQLIHEVTVPDTMTSWVTSAFAINENSGLGLPPSTFKLRVFRPFFIRLNLPYSVKRGEKLALQVLIFNYQSERETVQVKLTHNKNSGFYFVPRSGSSRNYKSYNVRSVRVSGDGGSKSVFFPIFPTKIGELKLHVSAIGKTASDAVELPLLVEPQGYRIDKNEPTLMNVTTRHPFDKTVQLRLKFPHDAIKGSQFGQVSFIGDIMGPMMENIENLVKMPSGCGEQNMVKLVPNIVVVKYLQATHRLEASMKTTAIEFMESGYQREMTYRHKDGSFSAFGPKDDRKGSTWLTAFVVRSLKQAQPYIFVDGEKLKNSINFLKKKQTKNGFFKEDGKVLGKYMQGGIGHGDTDYALTAYVLIALLENGNMNKEAVTSLERSFYEIRKDTYTLALTTYTLHLANSAQKEYVLHELSKKAIHKNGLTHWTKSKAHHEEKFYAPPVDVETTAYVLLTYVLRGDMDKAQPIIRWLNTKRNPHGGFSSTQDTVVGLQALGAYAEKVYAGGELNMNIDVKNGYKQHWFKINKQNSLVLQSYQIENTNLPVNIRATGNGVGFVQISWHYYTKKQSTNAPFHCKKTVNAKKGIIVINLCFTYRKTSDGSGMAVLEIQSLSGYTFDEEQCEKLKKSIKLLKRVDLSKGNTKASIYFEKITHSSPVCLNITSEMFYRVVSHKPAQLVLYDYYEPGDRFETDYSINEAKSMEETCPECWPRRKASYRYSTTTAYTTTSTTGYYHGSTSDYPPRISGFYLPSSTTGYQWFTRSTTSDRPRSSTGYHQSATTTSGYYRRYTQIKACSDKWSKHSCANWKYYGNCYSRNQRIRNNMKKFCQKSCQFCTK